MKYILLSLLVCVASFAHAVEKPNIVFILADDLGIGDVKCYGGDRCLIDTPNIDALAGAGTAFHRCPRECFHLRTHASSHHDGRYRLAFRALRQQRAVGIRWTSSRHRTFNARQAAQTIRLPHRLRWQMASRHDHGHADGKNQGLTNVDFTKPLRYGPMQFGFDESFILPGSLDMYPYAFARNNVWQGEVTAQKGWSAFNRVGPAEKDFEDHEVLETFYTRSRVLPRTTDRRATVLSLPRPHSTSHSNQPRRQMARQIKLGVYGDFVMEVDHSVERVTDALKAKGLSDNTLILFSSDHGPAPYAGNILKATPAQIHQLEEKGHFPSGPYRGYKFSVYEGGLRVPLIARWPGVIPEGATCNSLVGLCDLMATFAELTGEVTGQTEAPDSISFAPLLRSPSARGTRTDLVMESTMHFAIRQGDWKLCLTPSCGMQVNSKNGAGNEPLAEEAWRSALDQFGGKPTEADLLKTPFVQLYNLADDPTESHNIAAGHAGRVQSMADLLREQVDNGRSTPGSILKNDKRVRIVDPNDKRLPDFVKSNAQLLNHE